MGTNYQEPLESRQEILGFAIKGAASADDLDRIWKRVSHLFVNGVVPRWFSVEAARQLERRRAELRAIA